MDVKVVIDCKSIFALGVAGAAVILACKLDPNASERVLTHAVDAGKELAIAVNSSR